MAKFSLQPFKFRFSEKRTLHGLETAVWFLLSNEEKELAFEKLELSLGLIKRYTPEKFKAMSSDVKSIFVAGNPTCLGSYVRQHRMVELYCDYVFDSDTTPELLAGVIVHEAQHARLFRLGFGYDEPIRGRIEGLCHHANKIFALRIPNGEALAADAEAWREADPEIYYSNYARDQSRREALAELGFPNWILKLVDWKIERRYSKSTAKH